MKKVYRKKFGSKISYTSIDIKLIIYLKKKLVTLSILSFDFLNFYLVFITFIKLFDFYSTFYLLSHFLFILFIQISIFSKLLAILNLILPKFLLS